MGALIRALVKQGLSKAQIKAQVGKDVFDRFMNTKAGKRMGHLFIGPTPRQKMVQDLTPTQRAYTRGMAKTAGLTGTIAAGAGALGTYQVMKDKNAPKRKENTRGQIAGKGLKPFKTYTVKKGDTLTSIAKSARTTVAKLKKINKIEDVNKIRAGRKLKLSEKKMAMGGMATKKTKGMAKGGMSKKSKGMAKGGLKTPTANQKGLKKLPTSVRNNMGYMKKGGMMKSKGYAKGGMSKKSKGYAKGGMTKKK
tara:strand:- start:1669 stop:2421 length:753 start_codon:yes stop_codon:yes gene_type:complete